MTFLLQAAKGSPRLLSHLFQLTPVTPSPELLLPSMIATWLRECYCMDSNCVVHSDQSQTGMGSAHSLPLLLMLVP